MVERVRVDAPAKVNLRLRVLGRESSGFHSLETVFCAVSLADELEVERGGARMELRVLGEVDTGPPERNLVLRAARAFAAESGIDCPARLTLHKRIPAAAGLGGGSSDAAAALRALNALHGDPLPPSALLRIGASLGSDVPFFLCGSPLAVAWGRGERLLALPPLPSRPVLIAHPGAAMPTGEAFGLLAELRGEAPTEPRGWATDLSAMGEWEGIAASAVNDFDAVARERNPRFADALRALGESGARIALLAGSGSALFGVFDDDPARERAARPLRSAGWRVWPACTLERTAPLRVDPSGCCG